VPDLCQWIADLARLDDLGERKNNNLGAINGCRGTDSVPSMRRPVVSRDLRVSGLQAQLSGADRRVFDLPCAKPSPAISSS
jgi:hypothetical protein